MTINYEKNTYFNQKAFKLNLNLRITKKKKPTTKVQQAFSVELFTVEKSICLIVLFYYCRLFCRNKFH